MPSITFITADGRSHTLEIANGVSLMQAAVNSGIEGIDGTCGGSATCATCQVHVAAEWIDRLAAPSVDETSMLEFVVGRDESSRLSCQILLKEDLNGLVVRVPAAQG